jgi:hypothetical protein
MRRHARCAGSRFAFQGASDATAVKELMLAHPFATQANDSNAAADG